MGLLTQIQKDYDINDFVSGEKIQALCDIEYIPGNNLPHGKWVVYCCGDYIDTFLEECSKEEYSNDKYLLITHNSDVNINASHLEKLPRNVVRWFGQNMNVIDPENRLDCIPIGVANSKWPHGNVSEILETQEKLDNIFDWGYLCIKIDTNPKERIPWYIQARKTTGIIINDWPIDRKSFLKGIKNSLFTLCPPGNGIDSHRVWETLLMGRIPIVKKDAIWQHYFSYLPIVQVDKPEDITLEFMQEKTSLYKETFNFGKLFMNYWRQYIKDVKNSC